MTTKNKIILIATCVCLEIALITGAFCIGRFTRCKGTSKVGQDALDTVGQVTTDIDTSKDKVDLGINLLDPVVQANILLMESQELSKKEKAATMDCLENFVDLLSDSQKNIDSFVENYQGNKESDEFAWELMIQEAEQLEKIQKEYTILLEEYIRLKEGK